MQYFNIILSEIFSRSLLSKSMDRTMIHTLHGLDLLVYLTVLGNENFNQSQFWKFHLNLVFTVSKREIRSELIIY
jgi:hypothetical protein